MSEIVEMESAVILGDFSLKLFVVNGAVIRHSEHFLEGRGKRRQEVQKAPIYKMSWLSDLTGRPSDLAGRSSGIPRRGMNGRKDGRTDGKSPHFCPRQNLFRTLTATGAAALLQQRKLKSNKFENYR